MKNAFSAAPAARPAFLSESTRVAVGLAIALSCVFVVLLLSGSGPVLDDIATRILHQLAAHLVPASIVQAYLVMQYGVVLALGLAHVQRTRVAMAQQLPKSAGKPPVGSVPESSMWVTLATGGTATGLLLLLNQGNAFYPFADLVLGCFFGFTSFAGMAAFVVMIVVSSGLRLCHENCIRAISTLPTFMVVMMYFTPANLGLLVGLWALMAVLYPLESNTLPADYPEHFEAKQSASVAG